LTLLVTGIVYWWQWGLVICP